MLELLRYLNIINTAEPGESVFINSGSIASIISLILTILIFIGIKKIRSFYIFAGRGPEVVKSLEEITSDISNHLNDYESFLPEITLELARAEVALKTLKKILRVRDPKKSIQILLKLMKKYEQKPGGEQELRKIHVGIYKVIAEVREFRKDQMWEK